MKASVRPDLRRIALERLRDAVEAWVKSEPESLKYPGMGDEEPLHEMLDALDALAEVPR